MTASLDGSKRWKYIKKKPTNVASLSLFDDKRCIQQEEDSFHHQIGLKFKEETSNSHFWSTSLYGAKMWTLKVDQKYMESFEMWCWRTK
jgi:hypothetical protein